MYDEGDEMINYSDLFDFSNGRGLRHSYHGPVDNYGNPVRRTKHTHPYSYDGFVIWKSADYKPAMPAGTIYSDRLWEWDYEKAQEGE